MSFSSKSVSVARVPDDMLAGVSAGLAIVGVMRTCLSPVPVLSSFEQAVKTIAATAVNVKILFIILSFKLKIISYTQRRRDPVGLRDVFQTEAVFVTREYVDIEPFDTRPAARRGSRTAFRAP